MLQLDVNSHCKKYLIFGKEKAEPEVSCEKYQKERKEKKKRTKRHLALSNMHILGIRLCHNRLVKSKKSQALSIKNHNKVFLYSVPMLIRCDFKKSFKVQVRWRAGLVQKPASQEQPTEHIHRKSLPRDSLFDD